MDFSRRSDADEVMDDPGLDTAVYRRCLHELAAVNRLTLTHRPVLAWLHRATREWPRGSAVSILDVACGEGDLLRSIRKWADRRGLDATLEGIDLNPRSAAAASAVTPQALRILYRTGDVFEFAPRPGPDFIVTSQFAHHLDDATVVHLLGWLDRHAERGWLIADLHRHPLAYYGFPVLARLLGWHRIVRQDGMVSIARSFRREDWQRLLAEAALDAEVRWRLPFRYCVGRLK